MAEKRAVPAALQQGQGKRAQTSAGKEVKPQGGDQKQQAKEDLKTEQKLQAVLIADTYDHYFLPLAFELPKVFGFSRFLSAPDVGVQSLCPLVNIPLIDYSIEFLAISGVQEIFLFYSQNQPKVEEYLRWEITAYPSAFSNSFVGHLAQDVKKVAGPRRAAAVLCVHHQPGGGDERHLLTQSYRYGLHSCPEWCRLQCQPPERPQRSHVAFLALHGYSH